MELTECAPAPTPMSVTSPPPPNAPAHLTTQSTAALWSLSPRFNSTPACPSAPSPVLKPSVPPREHVSVPTPPAMRDPAPEGGRTCMPLRGCTPQRATRCPPTTSRMTAWTGGKFSVAVSPFRFQRMPSDRARTCPRFGRPGHGPCRRGHTTALAGTSRLSHKESRRRCRGVWDMPRVRAGACQLSRLC